MVQFIFAIGEACTKNIIGSKFAKILSRYSHYGFPGCSLNMHAAMWYDHEILFRKLQTHLNAEIPNDTCFL